MNRLGATSLVSLVLCLGWSAAVADPQRKLESGRKEIESGDYADATATGTGELDRTRSPSVETAVPEDRLRELNEELLRVPDSFTIHRKLRKPLSRRLDAMNEGGIEQVDAAFLDLKCIDLAYRLGIPTLRLNTGRWRTIENFDEFMKNRGIEPALPGYTEDQAFEWCISSIQKLHSPSP